MTVSVEDAIHTISKTGAGITEEWLRDFNSPQIEIVECRDMYHVPRHPVMPTTGMVPKDSFRLKRFKDGFFLEHFRCNSKTGVAQHGSYENASDLLYNIYPHQCNADAVMNSEIAYEMCVLKVHVEPLLKTVRPAEKEYSEVKRLLQTLDQFIAMPTNIIPPQSLLREFIGGSWYYDYGGWYKDY